MSKGPLSRNDKGYLYIMSNPAFRYLKIGAARIEVEARRKMMSQCTSVPLNFEIVDYVFVRNVWAAESELHNYLSHTRLPKKEFFDVSIKIAKAFMRSVYIEYCADGLKKIHDEIKNGEDIETLSDDELKQFLANRTIGIPVISQPGLPKAIS